MTLDELTTPITADQWKASIYDVMYRVGLNTTTWKPGAVVRTIVTATAIMLASLSKLIALIAGSGFLDLSTGPWLTLLARYQYGVERQPATFATGQVTITNSGGGIYEYDPGDLVFINATTRKTYRNTGSVSIGSLATVTIGIQAIEAGTGSTAQPGAINLFETPELGLSVTNAYPVVGIDEETDAALRVRCVEKLYTLAVGGAREAYSYWAKTTTRIDGSRTGVSRTRISDGSTVGHVTVTIATSTGAATAEDLARVDSELRRIVLPAGATLTTQNASALPIAVACEVWVSAPTMTQAEVNAAITSSVVTFLYSVPIGGKPLVHGGQGYVFRDMLEAAIVNTPDINVVHVTIATPSDSVAVGDTQVPVLNGSVTLTGFHQV